MQTNDYGKFDKLTELQASGLGHAESSGCRNIRDVESDLKAVCVWLSVLCFRIVNRRRMCCSKSRQTTRASSLSSRVCPFLISSGSCLTICCCLVVNDYGLETVQEYMYHIRANAESSVRNLLRNVAQRAGTNILESIDYLDDGSPV